ncbi:alpha/beta family hydrolase [Sneathiella sp.]|jgi:predicted alpha/beta-hydrolase family hydrolase|uniref:alpha/beta family hydrolase n=1 Tax=Sneathiella sp. TaxID=1964365 RepID=UPI0039E2F9CD
MYLENGNANSKTKLILAHGAGAPMDSPFMDYFAEKLAGDDLHIIRFEFPYMQERRENGKKRPPNKQDILLACWRQLIADFAGADRLFIGGKSMGGRMASLVADEGGVSGLVCLGYPFYAIGKQDKPRIDHLKTLKCPTLVVQGERDSMGNRDAVEHYDLSDSVKVFWTEDGDHSFKPRKASGRTEIENWDAAIDAVKQFI